MDGWDGSPGGPRYRAPTVLITTTTITTTVKVKGKTVVGGLPHMGEDNGWKGRDGHGALESRHLLH